MWVRKKKVLRFHGLLYLSPYLDSPCFCGSRLTAVRVIDKMMMKTSTLLKTGIFGSMFLALCCFTPLLVILFTAVGFAAWVAYLDMVLLPALVIFIGLMIYAFFRKKGGLV